MKTPILYIILCLIAFCSCREKSNNWHLFEQINSMCDSVPERAISELKHIDYKSLSESERHHYDLLSIKANDKAYVTHSSDSLILDVISYYSRHKKNPLYSEALYYGGRVHYDLGDLPTALYYFQQTIENIPNTKDYIKFKSTVFSQTGRLLIDLRLNSEAISYLNQAMKLYELLPNSYFSKAYDNHLLFFAYLALDKRPEARNHIEKAIKLSEKLPVEDKANMLTDLAYLLRLECKFDSALNIIRPLLSVADSISYPSILAHSSEIYRLSNIPDTAYQYARKLTRGNSLLNKKTGFKVIFSEELRDYVPKDTLIALIHEYKETLEDYLNIHEADEAIIQNSKYNYSVHDQNRKKAERKLHLVTICLLIFIVLFLITLSILLYIRLRKTHRKFNIVEAMNLSMKLKNENIYNSPKNETKDLKRKLIDEAILYSNLKKDKLLDPEISNSNLYSFLLKKVNSNSCISDKDTTWNEIKELINTVSPQFEESLNILTEERITESEKKVAMLMKFCFPPIKIAILIGRQRNTISSQRKSISNKIFGENSDLDLLDSLIPLL